MSGNESFLQLEQHLLQDEAPSAYLRLLQDQPVMRAYPFTMLQQLCETPQSPRHHPEGSVWNHTLLVVDEAAKRRCESADARVFMWAALLHDIGKPPTTKMRKDRITSYDHDKAGEKLAEEFLRAFTDDTVFIRRVCALVRYHMHILFVTQNLPFADMPGMRRAVNAREIALLGLCDRLGRKGVDAQHEKEIVRLFLKKCKNLNS